MRIDLLIALFCALNLLSQSTGQIGALLEAFLADFDDPEYVVQAGRGLDPAPRSVLNDLLVRRLRFGNATPAERVVIESVVIGDRTATVRGIKSPIAGVHGLTCSEQFVIPLRRSTDWQIVDRDIRAECVERAPDGLSSEDIRLLEAIRLAVSSLMLPTNTRLAAASSVSANALRVMRRVAEMPLYEELTRDSAAAPEGYFVIRTIEVNGTVVTVIGARTEVPRILPAPARPGCGTLWTVRFRHEPHGWANEEFSARVC